MSKTYNTPKFPRVIVTLPRHKKLATEATKRKITIAEVMEEKLKIADKASKSEK